MARIRTIKPEFFTSEDIVSLSPLARLLYVALWCEADKEGRLTWKLKTFKMRYLPGDKCDIEKLGEELLAAGLVVLYGAGYAHIPGFARHQHVNPRESKSVLPEPPTHVEREPSHIPADVRAEVMARDGAACLRCGSEDHLQLDHILPQSCGGPHVAANLRVLCRSCNAGRPVSGQALEDDLARDGFSVQMLRVKFGIDASNLDLLAQVGREGKGKEGEGMNNPPSPRKRGSAGDDGFDAFWAAYPNKTAKQAAAKAFEKLSPSADLLDEMLQAIARQKTWPKWVKDGGQYIPNPATWLNGGEWANQPPAVMGVQHETPREKAAIDRVIAMTGGLLNAREHRPGQIFEDFIDAEPAIRAIR